MAYHRIIFFCLAILQKVEISHKKEERDREEGGERADAEKHISEKARLNQALSGKLSEIQSEMELLFKKYALDTMPGLAHDVSCCVIEELYLGRFNLPEY